MEFKQTDLPGVVVISPKIFPDKRGANWEVYHQQKFAEQGIPHTFVQDNQSNSRCQVLRGLHYQVGKPQGKLVRVIAGQIYDVAVDLRRNSPTFCQWTGVILSGRNKHQLWIPPGFAHGFYTLSNWAQVSYKLTALYLPEGDRSLRWDDPRIGIRWPLLDGQPPMISAKDAQAPYLSEAEVFE